MRDISAEVAAGEATQRQAATLRSVTEAIPAIVAVVGTDGRYRFVNSAFERWRGLPREQIVGRSLLEVLGHEDHLRSQPWIDRVLAGETVSFERSYAQRHLALTYIPLRLDDGRIDGFVGVGQDITQHKQEEMRLLQLSQRDPLTGLLNRAGFEEHLAASIASGGGPQLALLYIDLDHFKPVNDTHGHPVGDRLLQAFAQRLRTLVRPTDAVARLGGDEFTVVLSGVREALHAQRIADKVIAAAAAPFEVDTLQLRIGASVGVAIGVDAQNDWRELVARADTLLYRAKQSGRGRQAGTLH
jgi:diguanylate cyclase (GGDEF)-like protein/PAS domain S-box-containing protein